MSRMRVTSRGVSRDRAAFERRTAELAKACSGIALATAATAHRHRLTRRRSRRGDRRYGWRERRNHRGRTRCPSRCGRSEIRAARSTELHLLRIVGAASRTTRRRCLRRRLRRCSMRRCSMRSGRGRVMTAKRCAARVAKRVVRRVLPLTVTTVHGPVCPEQHVGKTRRTSTDSHRSHGPTEATISCASGPVRTCAVKIATQPRHALRSTPELAMRSERVRAELVDKR